MKLIRRFSNNTHSSSPLPKMSRQITFTIPKPLEKVYTRYTQEVIQWKQVEGASPFTKRMIVGGALLGMCTGGAWIANRQRNSTDYYHRHRKEDIVFFMFMGTIAGIATGLVWPITPAFLVVYPIYKTFDIYGKGKGRRAPL